MAQSRMTDILLRLCYRSDFDPSEFLDYTSNFMDLYRMFAKDQLVQILKSFGVNVKILANGNIIIDKKDALAFIICKYYDSKDKEYQLEQLQNNSGDIIGASEEADYYVTY
jgi:hypothetical protein